MNNQKMTWLNVSKSNDVNGKFQKLYNHILMEKTPNDENMDRIVYFGNLELINIF